MKKKNFVPSSFKSVNVFETTDYDALHLLEFNRKINKAQVKKLVKTMKKWGFIGVLIVVRTNAIDGVWRYYVVDGQHRLAAARQLNLAVRFTVIELDSKEEINEFIKDMNVTGTNWGGTTFLSSYAGLGRYEYLKIDRVQKETGFQLTPLLEAYLFDSNQNAYRDGTMKFPNEEQSDRIIAQMVDLNQYLPNKGFCRRAVVKVMRNEKYNHEKMTQAIKYYINTLGKITENERDLKDLLDNMVKMTSKSK